MFFFFKKMSFISSMCIFALFWRPSAFFFVDKAHFCCTLEQSNASPHKQALRIIYAASLQRRLLLSLVRSTRKRFVIDRMEWMNQSIKEWISNGVAAINILAHSSLYKVPEWIADFKRCFCYSPCSYIIFDISFCFLFVAFPMEVILPFSISIAVIRLRCTIVIFQASNTINSLTRENTMAATWNNQPLDHIAHCTFTIRCGIFQVGSIKCRLSHSYTYICVCLLSHVS